MRHPQTLRSEDLSDIFEREGYGFELSAHRQGFAM
jgi:hypothetical protein